MNHTSNTAAGMTAFLDAEMIPPLAVEPRAQSASTVDGDRNPASTGLRGASPAASGRRPPIAVTNWIMLLFLMLAAIAQVRATEVSYNANGATSGTVPAAQTKTQDVPLTLRANSGNLARPGYTFVGWNTAADGSGDTYAAGASYDRAPAQATRHVVVASEAGFCIGWPANEGLLWVWGNEMLVGFTGARFYYRGDAYHPIDLSKGWAQFDAWLGRSLDGGETWAVEKPAALRGDIPLTNPAPLLGNIQSSNPDLIVRFRNQTRYFHVSPDRGRTWGPYQEMPLFGFSKLAGRTDYWLSGTDDGLFFLTAQPEGGKSRVIAVETLDGGKNWALKAPLIGQSIMPSTVRVSAQRLVMVTRTRGLQVHRSDDNGTTWSTLAFIDLGTSSNPASLVRLNDGRLAVTYGHRDRGQMCARLSTDDGASWSDEFILRDKAGNFDFGYPRSAQRADGVLVTAYYWNDVFTKERYIAATLWTPPPPNRADVAGPVTLYAQWGIGANATLALHWKFDETSGITSPSWGGNYAWNSLGGNEGRLMNMGAGVWTVGKQNNCLNFDGVNDYVNMVRIGDNFPPLSVNGDCAISLWMNRSGVPSTSVCLMDLATAGGSGMKLVVRPGGNASLDATGGLVAAINDTRNICDGHWHHVAAVRTGTTFRLYVDGVLAGSNSKPSKTAPDYTRLTVAANISGVACFGGKLDDVRVYRGAFSDTEIQALYNSQAVGPKR